MGIDLQENGDEIEYIEFTVDGKSFGVNISVVRQHVMYNCSPIKPIPNAHPAIEGVFKPRDEEIPVINLASYLHLNGSVDPSKDICIIINVNKLPFAFRVYTVEGVNRVSRCLMQKSDRSDLGAADEMVLGIVESGDHSVMILDFEKIVLEICPETVSQMPDTELLRSGQNRHEKTILIAEDSVFLSRLVLNRLYGAGYTNTVKVDNGQEAWDYLCKAKESGVPILEQVSLLVTDIEMPQMDGYRLCSLVKDDPVLKAVPVVFISLLITEEMRIKGEQCGADEQISKSEIAQLAGIVSRLT